VGLDTADFIVIAVLVGAGCLISAAGLWIMLRQVIAARQSALESRLDTLAASLKTLETRLAELDRIHELQAAATPEVEIEAPAAAAAPPVVQQKEEEVSPEMLVMIAAAVTAYLGKKVRVRSARMLQPHRESLSAWTQHGRMLIHSSHSPRSRS